MTESHVLVVLPHPDDEAFGISGSLASFIANGVPVTYICLTLGEMGRNMGNPLFANRETLPVIRRLELEQSCRAIGIQDLRRMGLLDKTVEFVDREWLVGQIGEVLEETKPSLVITFYPGYSVHPDHEATGEAVIEAVRRLPQDKRPKVHAVAFANGCEEVLGAPDVVRNVEAFVKQKIDSITAHKSQFQYFASRFSGGLSPDNPEVIRTIGKERFWTYPIH